MTSAKLLTTFFELHEVITQEKLLAMLDWSSTTMWEQVKLKDSPFRWHNGIHYFQLRPKGKLTFNKSMIQIWMTAKSQDDAQMHLNAIALFQQSIPGVAIISRSKRVI